MHLQNVETSITALNRRMKALLAFVEATKDGKIPKDHELLRQLSSVCHQLPIQNQEAFRKQFLTVCELTLLENPTHACVIGVQ